MVLLTDWSFSRQTATNSSASSLVMSVIGFLAEEGADVHAEVAL